MATAARERLAEMLGAVAPPAAPFTRMTAKASNLRMEVDGIGPITLPVTAERAGELCRLGKPARFGRGEETLTDRSVRDTWEIPKELVRVEWSSAFATALEMVRDGLGLPPGCALTAEFHSMLVYETGQFFAPHQDSEKDDSMVGSLVVSLPSVHTGGALVISHQGQSATFRGSKSTLSLVAFYSDCRHEVRPVTSGHRITLTYNLLADGSTGRPAPGGADVDAVAGCLTEHFATRSPTRTIAPNPTRRFGWPTCSTMSTPPAG